MVDIAGRYQSPCVFPSRDKIITIEDEYMEQDGYKSETRNSTSELPHDAINSRMTHPLNRTFNTLKSQRQKPEAPQTCNQQGIELIGQNSETKDRKLQ